jgi:N-acetylglucosamine-6-phosphate deacetylase
MPESPLFDFQVNGFGGVDFQRDDLSIDDFRRAANSLRNHGVGSIFATLITCETDRLCRRLAAMEKFRSVDPSIAQMIGGYHLEGPWLSPRPGFHGAHPSEPMHAPSVSEFNRLQEAANGRVRLVTLAPEWPGTPEFIAAVVHQGTHVSLGHTDANEAEIDAAVSAGARFATHLGNGTPLKLHRHDNIIQRLLARDELIACFIPDGIHLPPFTLRNFVRAKPAGRVLFTTDAMAGAGAGPGTYTIGDLTISVGEDGVARQPGGTGFAGSTLAPDEGVRRVAEILGIDQEKSRKLWSEAPAAAFGIRLPTEQ